ncbi:MAG: MBG domain-containing protein, partial [Terracidiphilus sp.]
GQQVSFSAVSATGSCSIASQSPPDSNGVSSATVALNSTGSCTITASQPGTDLLQPGNPPYYNAANSVSGTFTILPQGSNTQSQTINFPQLPNVQYGSTFSLSASSSSGLPVAFTASGPCTASGSTTGVGPCKITASVPAGAVGSVSYSAASASQSFSIYPAVLTVTAVSPPSVAYGQPLPALTYTTSPLVNGDSPSAVTGTPALSTTATTGSNAGNYPITVSTGTLAAANYSFLFVSGTLTIQPATATISISNIPASAVFGGSFTPAYLYSGNGSPTESVASSTTGVCAVSGGVVSFVGTGPCTLTASATATTDYSAVTGSLQSFTVGKATQTISFTQPTSPVIYGGSPITLSATATSGQTVAFSVDPTSTGTGTIAGNMLTVTGAGTLVIDANQTGNSNYTAAPQMQRTIVVSQAAATIIINNVPANAVYGGNFTPAYVYSGNGSPTESVASSTTGVCTVSGAMVSFVGVGTCTLTASATATTDYSAVTGSLQSFTVGKATQTITFSQPASPVTYGVSPIALSGTATSGLTVTFSVDPTSTGVGTISGNTLTVKGPGSLVIDANQSGNTDYQAATQLQRTIVVNKAALTVTANNATRAYGLANPTLIVRYSGFVNGDTFATAVTGSPSVTTTAVATSLPGSYPIVPSQGTLASAKYTFSFVNGALTVTFTGSVPASSNACNGAYNGTFQGNLNVAGGQTCIFVGGGATGNITETGGNLVLNSATVSGNVTVSGGGAFSIGPATIIKGNLQIQSIPSGSATNQVCATTISGSLQFQSNGTSVQIGSGSSSCAGNVINGNLQVTSNTAAITLDGNKVSGSLQVQSNPGATTMDGNTIGGSLQDQSNTGATQVFSNVITGVLQCQSNTSITGGGNTASLKQGQCATF